MKKYLAPFLALLLLCAPWLSRAEGEQPVYFLGNFAFGMSMEAVRALDKSGAALCETDRELETQRLTLLSDNFAVILWFQGLDGNAPLTEMDFAFFTAPDTVVRRENRLEIQTTEKTVSAVYAFVERLCKKTFGQGKNAPDGALPLPCLLFSGSDAPPALTRLRVYHLPDGGKTDVIVHFIAAESSGVNYVVCRQTDSVTNK